MEHSFYLLHAPKQTSMTTISKDDNQRQSATTINDNQRRQSTTMINNDNQRQQSRMTPKDFADNKNNDKKRRGQGTVKRQRREGSW